MNCLEISSIGSACGKNPFEPRYKTMLLLLCRRFPYEFKQRFKELKLIEPKEDKTYDIEIKQKYKEIKKTIKNPDDFERNKKLIIDEIKSKPDCKDSDVKHAEEFLNSSMKKDCGTNNEPTVIQNKKYKKGNNKMYTYSQDDWIIKGYNDATDSDIVIEIKTRMSQRNVRKNEYDLYQLFGYLLAMGKTKGQIVQYFNNIIYNSGEENQKEYGIINITIEPYKSKFSQFKKELNDFFIELRHYISNTDKFDMTVVFPKIERIALYDEDGQMYNVNPKYERIIQTFTNL
jgi:hypothetical protein